MTRPTLLVLCVAGCTKTESSDVLTAGMSADMAATASDNGTTTVSATLYVGDPLSFDFVELTGSDELDSRRMMDKTRC